MTSQEQRDKVLRMMHNQNTTLEISGQLGIPLCEVVAIIQAQGKPPEPPRKVEFIEPTFDIPRE